MKYFLSILFILASRASTRRISKTTCGSSTATFYRIGKANETALQVTPLSELVVESLDDCIDLCVDADLCKAFNYRRRKRYVCDCHLLQHDHTTNPADVKKVVGWNLYDTGSLDLTERAVGYRCRNMEKNPCPPHCTCVDTCKSYRCDCNATNIYTSCTEALLSKPSGENYWILNASMTKAVLVLCKVVAGTVHAVFGHNSEATTYVNGYEPPASYKRPIKYGVNSFEDIAAFVDSSASCKQFIRLRCRDTLLFRGSHGYVKNRIGKALSYIGGGPSNGLGCACGVTHTCYNPIFHCNCDSNEGVEVIDEGYFENKLDLPITEIIMGDTGSSGEYVYFTLHPLDCIEN